MDRVDLPSEVLSIFLNLFEYSENFEPVSE